MRTYTGVSARSATVAPDMPATDKQRILKEATALFGRKVIAEGLNVSEALLDSWNTGDATMPDGLLLRLADLLVKLAAKRALSGKTF